MSDGRSNRVATAISDIDIEDGSLEQPHYIVGVGPGKPQRRPQFQCVPAQTLQFCNSIGWNHVSFEELASPGRSAIKRPLPGPGLASLFSVAAVSAAGWHTTFGTLMDAQDRVLCRG